ncbi:hypothetical protein [Mesorhizobium amorphae]|uniref:hypothetical protein n=1 Tax=Mesorhizobium amorphae TaxID=71433 RepID=UPI001786774C|nr:hypothetical protein [Mesorhizobium amorphae]
MKHQTLDHLQAIADVKLEAPTPKMTRTQRIKRWAELLEAQPARCLGMFVGTEYLLPQARQIARAAGSPITVAFEDPLLRAAGLQNDTYGEAKRFFELADWQLHDIVCSCHAGTTTKGKSAAATVRRVLSGRRFLVWLRYVLIH